MSTPYYYLRKPITSIRPEVRGIHTHVGVWVNHAMSGTLVFRNEEWKDAKWLFVDDDDSRVPIHVHWGGKELGTVVTENVQGLDPALQLMDESGRLTTVRDIRAKAGAGKES